MAAGSHGQTQVIAPDWKRSDTIRADSGLVVRKPLILKRRDVRVVEGARLEIALAICDGVLQISITVAKPTT